MELNRTLRFDHGRERPGALLSENPRDIGRIVVAQIFDFFDFDFVAA